MDLFRRGDVVDLPPEAKQLLATMTEIPLLSRDEEHAVAVKLKAARTHLAELHAWVNDPDMPPETEAFYHQRISETEAAITEHSNHLFYANIRWVLKLANTTSRLEFMERFQWASIGLWRAIKLYDPDLEVDGKSIRISTYATYWIRQAMQRGADQDERLIRLPVHANDILKLLNRTRTRFIQEKGYDPSITELCDAAMVDYEKVQPMLHMAEHPLSLHMEYDTGGSETTSLMDSIADPSDDVADVAIDSTHRQMLQGAVREAIDQLEAVQQYDDRRKRMVYPYIRHAQLLRLRYRIGEPEPAGDVPAFRTLEEVGKLLTPPVTRERARQIQRIALHWIRTNCVWLRLYMDDHIEDEVV